MVSKVVGTCIPKNLDMGMCLLGRVTRCWKMRVADCRFRVEMENMAEAVGKSDLVRETGKAILGKLALGLQIHPWVCESQNKLQYWFQIGIGL